MKWSVNGECGMTPLTVGMWHEMQPVAGLTGQIVACGASVNALPPLKWCSFWANPSLDEFSAQGPVPTPWTQVDPGVFSRLRRAAPGDLPTTLWVRLEQFRPNGWRLSHDVATRLMFSSRADSFSPANRLHLHYQGTNPSVSRASP